MTKIPYTAPTLSKVFNCPWCKAFAHQSWGNAVCNNLIVSDFKFSMCNHCNKYAFWVGGHLIYPRSVNAPLPNEDLNENIRQDFEEARGIVEQSPRGAAALLRLCIQKLCKQLGKPGKNINSDIGGLVRDGLDPRIQKALDIVRVIGNEAVHPGELDLKDDKETAFRLFDLVNLIADDRLTKPKQVATLYDKLVPEKKKEAIEKRDGTIKPSPADD